MRSGHRKAKIFLLIAGLVLVSLLISSPFLHNHPNSPYENVRCPAYLIQTSLITLLQTVLVIPVFALPLQGRLTSLILIIYVSGNYHHSWNRRAPPTAI